MKTVLILCGGKSDEHEISLISAKCVLDALNRDLYQPIIVGISRNGVWHLENEKTFYKGACRADEIKLNLEAPKVFICPFLENGKGLLISDNKKLEFDIVFPILHGPFGEDGTMQGLLDIVGIPYVGTGCGGSWVCMDKTLTKSLSIQNDIPVSDFISFSSLEEFKSKQKEIEKWSFPLFVKPARLGSSVGISKVESKNELEKAVLFALKYDSLALIEKAIVGREIECAVLGETFSAKVAEIGEIIPSKKIGWYSYEAKYLLSDGAKTVVPAQLTEKNKYEIKKFALRVFKILQCYGMARIDLFLTETGEIYLNEANTIPGFTPISMYPQMWQASGLNYSDLITELLILAEKRTYSK